MTLDELFQIIVSRKEKLPENSYLTTLFKSGNDRVIQKVGEEAVEVVIAAKNSERGRVISEVADLIFHLLALLAILNITLSEIFTELEKRRKSQGKK